MERCETDGSSFHLPESVPIVFADLSGLRVSSVCADDACVCFGKLCKISWLLGDGWIAHSIRVVPPPLPPFSTSHHLTD